MKTSFPSTRLDASPEQARNRLQAEQARVEGLISEFRGEFTTDENDGMSELADYDQHPADSGTEMHEQELDETTDMILADEAEQVELALQRLAEGTYGTCIDCGREIPPERLEAVPEAIRCIDDQRRYEGELRERRPGPPPQFE